jgi:hypothetical protein
MLNKLRHIILLLVLSLGVLSNGFAHVVVQDASKISLEKGAEGQCFLRDWETILSSTDDGIKALRSNPTQLQKYTDILVSNNLGLDEAKLFEIQNAVTHSVEYTIPPNGLKVWDGPAARQAILDNVNKAHLPGGSTQIYIPDLIRQDGSFSNLQLIPLSL